MKQKHKPIFRGMEYRQFDDCIAYELHCSCGIKFYGWITQELEEEFLKHKEKEKTKCQK